MMRRFFAYSILQYLCRWSKI